MGEIGIPRREFLYDLRFWEAQRIVNGYRRRHRLTHQLLAECVYAGQYAMRDPQGKTVADLFPMLFDTEDDDEEDDTQPISEADAENLRKMMREMNEKAGKK